jgi:uncharacterized membrane protein YgcG
MFLLVTLTGASGFVASYILLHAGFVEMWLRYLASFGVAYLMFLFLLWLWLRTRAEDYADLPDISGSPSSGSGSSGTCYSGKGGYFGGGGASGSFDPPSESISVIGDSGSSVGDALSSVAEAEEFAIPLVVLILLGAMLFSSIFMIYSAPVLFVELLVDGILSASIADFAVLKRVTGLRLLSAVQLCLSRLPLQLFLLPVGAWRSMRRRPIQLAMSFLIQSRAASMRRPTYQSTGCSAIKPRSAGDFKR